MKILCAAAAERKAFRQCLDIGRAINDQTVTIGSVLDHCHVPGRQHQSIADDACVVGAGIHNEPGQQMIRPLPSIEHLVEKCLELLCSQADPERSFVRFDPDDKVLLLVNNYGGLSVLELGAITDEVQTHLATKWNIEPCRTFSGTFETSLNAPGFSVTLCNISAASRQSGFSDDELLGLLDRQTTAVAWPNTYRPGCGTRKANPTPLSKDKTEAKTSSLATIRVSPGLLKRCVQTACEFAIAAEPRLTEWDMVQGDGDCGEAVKALADLVLRKLDTGLASDGSVIDFLTSLGETVDDMGGTLGAIFGILLAAFSASLQSAINQQPGIDAHAKLFASALESAVVSLKSHTSAREGDRTVMDVLLPFASEFARSSDLASAVRVAAAKAEGTRFLQPKLGRATYVGGAEGRQLPDPGAWALYEILAGLATGLGYAVDRRETLPGFK